MDAQPTRADPRPGGRALLFGAVVALAACLALGVASALGLTADVDRAVTAAAAPWRPTVLGDGLRAWQVVGELGPFLGLLLVPAVVLLAVGRRAAAAVLAGGTIATLLSSLIKIGLGVPRPVGGEVTNVLGESFAYPSGHTTRAAVALGLLALVVVREVPLPERPTARVLGVVVMTGVVLMAAARVVSGEHWLSDVTGGALLGGAWLAATVWAWRWFDSLPDRVAGRDRRPSSRSQGRSSVRPGGDGDERAGPQ